MHVSPLQRLFKSIGIMSLHYNQHDYTPANEHALDVIKRARRMIHQLVPQLEAVKDDRKARNIIIKQQAHRLLHHLDFYKLMDELRDTKIWNMLERHERNLFGAACELVNKPV